MAEGEEALEVRAAVAQEVEVEGGDSGLKEAPEAFAHVGGEAHEPEVPEVVIEDAAEVNIEEGALALLVELAVHGEVSEVKESVAHAGVLPVDDAGALAVINEVRGEEVIMAGAGLEGAADFALNAGEVLESGGHGLGHGDAVGEGFCMVIADGLEGREGAWDGGSCVDFSDGEGDAAEDVRVADIVGAEDAAVEEARDDGSMGGEERDDVGAYAGLHGGEGGCVLAGAVDAEVLGARASDADDEGAGRCINTVIMVGNAAG